MLNYLKSLDIKIKRFEEQKREIESGTLQYEVVLGILDNLYKEKRYVEKG